MEENFDEFFDSPRQSHSDKSSSKSSHTDSNFGKPVGKPPTHPNSRPGSAANKGTPTSPVAFEGKDAEGYSSRRVIEAKVPCDVVTRDYDGLDSDDSFIEEDDDGSSIEGNSGRRSPQPPTGNSDQRYVSQDRSDHDARPSVTGNNAQDLSDYSESYTDDTTDDDDDSEVDVSPLNTPHSPNVHTASACSSSASKNVSKSSNNEPVRLLHGDRDSLDLDVLLHTVLQMEKQGRPLSRQTQSQQAMPSSRSSRVNYSFTNERVQAIDKENRRLMTSIMRHANAVKKAKANVNKLSASGTGTKRLSSAAVNRVKQQQQIEAENLMLLKRLQQTRPSKDLRRDVLVGSQSTSRVKSARPLSRAGVANVSSGQRPSSGRRPRPTSAYTAVQRNPRTSRPATAFPSRPDDDDVLTWQPEDF